MILDFRDTIIHGNDIVPYILPHISDPQMSTSVTGCGGFIPCLIFIFHNADHSFHPTLYDHHPDPHHTVLTSSLTNCV